MERLAKYEYRPAAPATGMAAMAAALSIIIGFFLGFILVPPSAWRWDAAVAVPAGELWANILAYGLAAAFSAEDLARELMPRAIGIAIALLISGWLTFRMRRSATPVVDRREHYDGLQLVRGKAATGTANAHLVTEFGPLDRTIQWFPGVAIPRTREVGNLLILGAIGSGKTRIVLYLLDQLIERQLRNPQGDYGLFVHDTTGEILDGLPMADGTFAVINPDRPDSWAWAIGRDLVSDSDCESAANQMVEQTGEAIWGKGGATLFAGCMIVCKAQHATKWGAAELYEACLRDPALLKSEFEQHYPPAAKLIEFDASGEPSKTTVSFLLTYRASVLRVLRPLAQAWANVPGDRQFSFGDWVSGGNLRQPKVVLVQRCGRHPDMSAAWIGMVMDHIAAAVGDLKLAVSQTRIRTFMLDEVASLGKLQRWTDLLDTGRNKGVSTVAAIQDVAQFKRLYSDAAPSIFQRFRTKIICAQTQGPETTELANETIGKRWVLEEETETVSERGPAGLTQRSSSRKRPSETPIVRPEHLTYRLGVRNARVRALVAGLGDVLEIEWPMRVWRKRRRK